MTRHHQATTNHFPCFRRNEGWTLCSGAQDELSHCTWHRALYMSNTLCHRKNCTLLKTTPQRKNRYARSTEGDNKALCWMSSSFSVGNVQCQRQRVPFSAYQPESPVGIAESRSITYGFMCRMHARMDPMVASRKTHIGIYPSCSLASIIVPKWRRAHRRIPSVRHKNLNQNGYGSPLS